MSPPPLTLEDLKDIAKYDARWVAKRVTPLNYAVRWTTAASRAAYDRNQLLWEVLRLRELLIKNRIHPDTGAKL